MNPTKGDQLMRYGAIVLVLGMICTAIAILPLFTDLDLPSIWWGLSMLTGLGLGMILVGLKVSSKKRSRYTRSSELN
jgi:hypothetical protein